MGDVDKPARKVSDVYVTAPAAGAAPRTRSEVATLVCAVTVAVALGVACGFWINSLLASSAAARRAAPASPRVQPAALFASASPAAEAKSAQASAGTADVKAPARESPTASAESRALRPAATPAAREATARSKSQARLVASFVTRESEESEEGESARPSAPCALNASAGALNMRSGGAAFLVVGGPGETGPVTVSTQSWADIAVVREGQAANGWVRYAVKSTSNRPGLYTVNFSTSCGSQTIPVTVK
ncbi:MAG: hypothetical protein JOZ96_13530 [Acidobacteria bacterium]|nr:hypothetical protein [Acidobacteriota bacterium]